MVNSKSVQIVTVSTGSKENALNLNEEALYSILLRPDVRDKNVVVISVVGAFRKGKSFLLDFFLRYLKANGNPKWLGESNEPLSGFHWRGGSERDTTGIHMWSEPFLITIPSGEEVAVLLMDTQGSFDSKSTVKQCATIFALSTMLSSKQVYNIKENLQEDDLQHLQFFTEYGRIALESGSRQTPFQYLEFLIRDWCFGYEMDYGSKGGMELLKNRLTVDEETHKENANLRYHITSCFSDLRCYLMPHPGRVVAGDRNFDGRLSDIDPQFVEQLKDFVPHLLAPENLIVKSINGQKLTCRDLVAYFKAYVEIYKGETLPEPVSALQATAEANNLNNYVRCREQYVKEMHAICGPNRPYVVPSVIQDAHNRIRNKVITAFKDAPKMGGDEISEPFGKRLQVEIDALLTDLKQSNESKNTLNHIKTPGVLLLMIVVFYMVTGFFDALGLSVITNMLYIPFWLLSLCLITWMAIKYTGSASELGEIIDEGAEVISQNFIMPTIHRMGQEAASRAVGLPRT